MTSFNDLPGWAGDDHAAAFVAFRRSCAAMAESASAPRPGLPPPPGLEAVCARALAMGGMVEREAARAFFERFFQPVRVSDGGGLMTGYFEPEFAGRRRAGPGFTVPLLARPDDLVSFAPGEVTSPALAGLAAARRRADGGLEPYPDRAAIEDGALSGRGLEFVHIADPFEAFLVQVQGSARIRLEDGTLLRVAYAGRNGHPYTSIGAVLIARGLLTREETNIARIRALFSADPALAREVMRQNRSFVFFRVLEDHDPALGPIGAQGVPLTPLRSVAVDRSIHAYGLPFFVHGRPAPDGLAEPPRGLMIAQDTGSAILSEARIDVFIGSGIEAGEIAGYLKNPLDLYVLRPRLEGAP